jgi:hypothetical protein
MRARNQSRTVAFAFGEAVEIAHWRLAPAQSRSDLVSKPAQMDAPSNWK